MVLARVYAVSDPVDVGDPTYQDGLRAAVSAALDYGLAGIGSSERNLPPVPPVLLSQARLAARSRVGLDTVLRRYFAGYTLLGDFLIEEAQAVDGPLRGAALKRMLRIQAGVFDRLVTTISENYEREARARAESAERRLARRVEHLLEGRPLDTSEIAYDFGACHLALVAKGPDLHEGMRELAQQLDRRLLLVFREEETAWAWLGGRQRIEHAGLERALDSELFRQAHVAIGEPAEGTAGWRRTHRQARAALQISLRGPKRIARYADVALLASIVQDELLVTSLREVYLKPIEEQPDGGEMTREALRAYFASGCNISSAAAASGLNRNTIAKRIRAIEEVLGSPLASCAAECEMALKLEELNQGTTVGNA